MSARGSTATIRMQLQNARATIAGLAATGQQIGALNQGVGRYNVATRAAHERTWLMNQALFTMRRFAYAGTLGLVGLTAAAVHLGLGFNMAMEQNTIAMTHFLGSEAAARQELGFLYNLAAKTPFEFQQVSDAARRFMAFGFSLKETNQALLTIGDTAAGLGGDPAQNIERLVLVLGQVRATGRVLGQDMLQLQQLGINTNKIFQDQLGISQAQLRNGIGALNIPASVAIPALLRGMQQQFAGMAAAQSKTLTGLLSTLHDYTSQLFGEITRPGFERLRDRWVPALISLTQEMSKARQNGASFMDLIGIIDQHLGAHGGLSMTIGIIVNFFKSFGAVMSQVVFPSMRMLAPLFFAIILGLNLMSRGLLFASRHSTIFRIVLVYLIGTFVIMRTWMAIMFFWNLRLALAWGIAAAAEGKYSRALRVGIALTKLSVIWARRAWAATWFQRFAVLVLTTSLYANARAWVIQTIAMIQARVTMVALAIASRIVTAAQWLLNIAMYAFPGTWILLAIAAVMLGFYYLDRRFHIITKTVVFLWQKLRDLRDILHSVSDRLEHSVWGRALKFLGAAQLHYLFPASLLIGHLGSGGGGRGGGTPGFPSLMPTLATPGGTTAPIGQGATPAQLDNWLQVNSTLYMDEKKVGEGVTKHKLDRQARK